MKKTLPGLLGLVTLPFVLILLFAHYLGLVFAISLITAGIAGWWLSVPVAVTYFSVGWKVYFGFSLLTFAFLTTFVFQNCCVGMQSFKEHLKHHGWSGIAQDAIDSLIWPWSWFQLDRFLKGWGLSFADALCNAIEYWFVSSWRGIPVTHIDFQTGEVATTYIKKPEDARDAIQKAVAKSLD